MGELKDIRDQQDNLIQRAKTLGNKLYLAGLGAYSKAGDSSEELYGKYVQAGQEAYGEDAEGKSKALLASRGLVVNTRQLIDDAPRKRHELYEQFVANGKQERGEKAEETNEFVLAGLGAVSTLREQSQKLFDDLVSTGEKERA
jgi:hypothetical protein